MHEVSMTVSGRTVRDAFEGRTMLVDFLRERLGLTGTHVGCDTTQCGACVVHVNGLAVKSCTMLALQCAGAVVTTIEGLAAPARHSSPSDTGGLPGAPRASVRLLHVGHGDDGARYRASLRRARRGDDSR